MHSTRRLLSVGRLAAYSFLLFAGTAACSHEMAADADQSAVRDDALTSLAASRPTEQRAATQRGGQIQANILVDPPTGAGWASPAIMINYTDRGHVFGSASDLTAHVTVHFSAPTNDVSSDILLESIGHDSTGALFFGHFFLAQAEIQHVEGVALSISNDQGTKWDAQDTRTPKAYHLGGIRPDTSDAASISPYDRVVARGVTSRVAYVPPGAGGTDDGSTDLDLTVDVNDAVFLREEAPGYDGQATGLAKVPHTLANGSVEWQNFTLPLAWSSSGTTHFQQSPDMATLDRATITRLGVAFGLKTNVGTLWLQSPGQNTKPVNP